MTHKMGLVEIDMNPKDIYDEVTYNGNLYDSDEDTWTVISRGTATEWNASTIFTGTYEPQVIGTACYQVVKPNETDLSYTTTTDETNHKYAWSANCGTITEPGSYSNSSVSYNAIEFVRAYWIFDYTGEVKSWKAPLGGTYKLEVWGADGAGRGSDSYSAYYGGKAGYSYYNLTITQGLLLYVCAGECLNSGSDVGKRQGYNGGGRGVSMGGGCTHIAITNNRGELKNYSSNRDEVLVVAGGGGGADGSPGGYAGGAVGQDAPGTWGGYSGGKGGNNSTGVGTSAPHNATTSPIVYMSATNGSFGQGGYQNDNTRDQGGGGGGGWCGGGGSSWCAGGGGGTGYVNTSYANYTSGATIAGNSSSWVTRPVNNGYADHWNNGSARISYIPN